MQLDEVKAKVETSYLEKYGGHPMHNKEVKDKWIKVINNKYGGNSPLCDEEIRSKAINTINELGNIPTSSQQVSIFNLLKQNYPNCSLNYIDGIFALDIMLEVNGQRFDIEYDGKYWHQDEQKDRRRDEVLKSRGYKILRVKAKHKIPTLEQLQEGLEYLNNHDYSQIILE